MCDIKKLEPLVKSVVYDHFCTENPKVFKLAMKLLCKGYAAAEMEHYFQEWLDPFCAVRLAYSLEIVHREHLAQQIMQKQLKEKSCELEQVTQLLENKFRRMTI